MQIKYGDMWNEWGKTELFLITCNSFVKVTKDLVMGAGIARAAANKFPDLASLAGEEVLKICGQFGEYLVIAPGFTCTNYSNDYLKKGWPDFRRSSMGLFQVKHHWKEDADVELIKRSVDRLGEMIEKHRISEVDLNFPGIGAGRLDEDVVHPLIEQLPDIVNVWKFSSQMEYDE